MCKEAVLLAGSGASLELNGTIGFSILTFVYGIKNWLLVDEKHRAVCEWSLSGFQIYGHSCDGTTVKFLQKK